MIRKGKRWLVAGCLAAMIAALTPVTEAVASEVITGSSVADVAKEASEEVVPSGTATVVYIAVTSSAPAVAQAAVNAAVAGGVLLLAEPSSDGSDVLPALQSRTVTDVRLVGPTESFGAAFKTALAGYVLDETRLSSDSLAWSDAKAGGQIVLLDLSDAAAVETATMVAIQTGFHLAMYNDVTPRADIVTLASDASVSGIVLVGNSEGLELDSLPSGASEKFSQLPAVGANDINPEAVRAAIAVGASAKGAVIAADDDLAGIAVAGYYAALTSRPLVFGAGGAASSSDYAPTYLELLGTRATDLTLVGVSATTSSQAAFAAVAAGVPTHTAPTFRVTGQSISSGTRTVSLTTVASATQYRALDATGATVATSSSPSLDLPTGVMSALIEARSGTTVLSSFQLKLTPANEDDETDLAGQFAASRNGPVSIVFAGGAGVPRHVSRGAIDPADPTGSIEWTFLGITCDGSFVDATQPVTTEYKYQVETLSNHPSACELSGSADSRPLIVSEVPYSAEFDLGEVASESRGQKELRRLQEQSTKRMGGMPPVMFRYNTFIPTKYVWAGEFHNTVPTGPVRYIQYNGNDRTFHPNGTYKTRLDATVYFDGTPRTNSNRWVGETIKYSCATPDPGGFLGCYELDRDTAPTSEISVIPLTNSTTSATFRFKVDATIPFLPWAPDITSDLFVKLQMGGGSYLSGSHDMYPSHEVYWGMAQSEWWKIYQRSPALGGVAGPTCLTGIPSYCKGNVFVLI